MKHAEIVIDRDFTVGEVDKRVYGSFIENLGRAIYDGIYQPDSPFADEQGFRKDTLALIKELQVPIIRYPGGNFVSSFYWEDSVGPKEERPKRMELAWSAVESNQFGINEYCDWIKKAKSAPMMALNFGTRGMEDALNLLEYCNFDCGTKYSELRKKHGYEKPHKIKTWCLGNEMDGEWQVARKTPEEYARLAAETAKIMKCVDPEIELIACGSSHSMMPTFGEWEARVLEEGYDYIDYISMHQYYGNKDNDTESFLASTVDLDKFIQNVIAVCDYVKGKKHSDKTINISLDEWNVWYHSLESDESLPRWTEKPHQLEDIYNFEDALVVGGMLITILRHADRIKIACLAQLVNVIAPIMTSDTGAWRQTTFYPYLHASTYGHGVVLQTLVKSPMCNTKKYGEAPYLDSVVVWNEQAKELVVFAVNKSLDEDMEITLDLKQFADYTVAEHIVLHHEDVKAINSEEHPDNVVPTKDGVSQVKDGVLTACLKNKSWNVIRLTNTR